MLLAVDIGNTQTVIGLFSESDLVSSWRIVTDVRSTTDELLIKLRALLDYRSYDSASLDSFVLASVVPALTSHWYDLASDMGLETMVIGSGTQTELKLSSDLHREVGADRLADCVGALSLYGAPCIIVDLGTATNMEVIDREGTFLGGIIAPGFVTGADALFEAAARLTEVDLVAPPRVIGTTTVEAVQSGLMYGEVARIDGLVRGIFDELGYRATVVATGGLYTLIAGLSETIDEVNENLTLVGLQRLFERNDH